MSLTVDVEKRLGKFSLDVSFATSGGVLGLLGASGSGKSMTLKCIAGIERPDRGQIVLNGQTLLDTACRVNRPPQERRVGYLFQNYALFPNMTVRQNIFCGMRRQRDRRKRETEMGELIALLQLEGLEDRRPQQLSGGQQQRVALARILASRPALLMLDEPFNALDHFLRDQLQVEMKKLLSAFEGDVVLVTHDRNEAYHLCDRVAVVDGGRVLDVRETAEIFRDPRSRAAARLTGCRNVSPSARKTGEYQVEIPDWGIRLDTSAPVEDGIQAVGLRPESFSAACLENRFPIRLTGRMEHPAGVSLCFRYAGQQKLGEDLWWDCPEHFLRELPEELGIPRDGVLLLYE